MAYSTNPPDRLARLKAAVRHDSGLAIQMARYSHEDVMWLVALLDDALQALAVVGELTVADRPYDWRIDEIVRTLDSVKVAS